MSRYIMLQVSPCEHGKEHGVTGLWRGMTFYVPGCKDSLGNMKAHLADPKKYPETEPAPDVRKQRSDIGKKRGPRRKVSHL